jgi:Mrp family chromosome partitioning ATPase
VGEISDALRRARDERNGEMEGRGEKGRGPAPEHLSKRIERRPPSPGREPDLAHPPVAESTDEHRLSLDRNRGGKWQSRAVVLDEGSPATESFRQLALRVRAELQRRSSRSVAITGPLHDEGKTTIACGLALALASLSRGREVALVDLDLRRPSLAADLRIPTEAGVEEFILGERALSEVCVSIEKPAVDVFPAVSPNDSAHELFVQPGFASLVRELELRYATVICDTPPVLLVPDTSLALDQVSTYIAVGRSGETRERALQSLLELLPRDRLLGTVLNEGSLSVRSRLYDYYGEDSVSPATEE